MVRQVMVRQGGGSVILTVPKEQALRHHLVVGQEVSLIDTDQGLLITAYDSKFANAMAALEEGAAAYRNALRELSSK